MNEFLKANATDGAGEAPASDLDYGELRARLARAVSRACPSWLGAQQDDIIQAAVLKVHQLQQAEGNRVFSSSYLTKVAYSATVDEIRRMRRRRETRLDEVDPDRLGHSGAGSAEVALREREVGGALRDCLGRVVEARRQAVTLFLQGHRVPEIARLLGWPIKRAENLVYRGLGDVRRCLAAKGLQP